VVRLFFYLLFLKHISMTKLPLKAIFLASIPFTWCNLQDLAVIRVIPKLNCCLIFSSLFLLINFIFYFNILHLDCWGLNIIIFFSICFLWGWLGVATPLVNLTYQFMFTQSDFILFCFSILLGYLIIKFCYFVSFEKH
jgi:hypothetical protein